MEDSAISAKVIEIVPDYDDDECCIIDSSNVDITIGKLGAVVEDPSGFTAVESMPQAVCNIEDVYVLPILCIPKMNCLPHEVFGSDLGSEGDGGVTEEKVTTQSDGYVFEHGSSASLVQIMQHDINETETVSGNNLLVAETNSFCNTLEVASCKFEQSEANENTEDMNQDMTDTSMHDGMEGTGIEELQPLLQSVKDEHTRGDVAVKDVLAYPECDGSIMIRIPRPNCKTTPIKDSEVITLKTKVDHSISDVVPTDGDLKDMEFCVDSSGSNKKPRQQSEKTVSKKPPKRVRTRARYVETKDVSSDDEITEEEVKYEPDLTLTSNESDIDNFEDADIDHEKPPKLVRTREKYVETKDLSSNDEITEEEEKHEADLPLTSNESDIDNSEDASIEHETDDEQTTFAKLDESIIAETRLERRARLRRLRKGSCHSCNTCSAGPFTTKRGLAKHMFHHANEEIPLIEKDGLYVCQVCNKSFKKRGYLLNHRAAHTRSECSKCDKVFPSLLLLNKHRQMEHHSKTKTFICTICGKDFARKFSLKLHSMLHRNKNLLLSMNKECEDKVVNGRHLQRHPCLACGKLFIRPIRWLHHMKIHLEQDDVDDEVKENISKVLEENKTFIKKTKVFICNICGKVNYNQPTHSLHMSRHTEDNSFDCIPCKKKFASLELLHAHESETHNPYGFLKCCHCDESFTRIDLLKKHEHRAHGIRDPQQRKRQGFTCDMCEYTAKIKARIIFHKAQVHQVREHGLVEHICELCLKSFATSYALRLHKNTHNNIKPFNCQICGKSYSDPSNLIQHGTKKHPGQPKELFYRPRY